MSYEISTIGEVCEFSRGLTYKKADEVEFSKNAVLRANNITLESGQINFDEVKYISENIKIPTDKKVKEGSLLICTASGSKKHLGKVALIEAEMDFAFGGFMGMLTPKKCTEPKFLYWLMQSNQYADFILSLTDGANINNLKFSQLSKFPVPLPSATEQKRIVAILDKAFAAIDEAKAKTEQNLQNARELFDSYLQQVFSQRGEGFCEIRWGDTCEFIRGPFGGSLKKSMFVESGYAVYEQKHAIHDHIEQIRYFIDQQKFDEMKRFEVKHGDLIMSCSGVTLGRVSIIPEGAPKGIINQALLKLSPKENISRDYLKYWIRSKIFQDIIFSHSGGAAIPNVPSAKILKEIKLNIPDDIEKQNKIVNKIDFVFRETEALSSVYKKKLENLEKLKKSLLHKAFSGELTANTIDEVMS